MERRLGRLMRAEGRDVELLDTYGPLIGVVAFLVSNGAEFTVCHNGDLLACKGVILRYFETGEHVPRCVVNEYFDTCYPNLINK